jgi:hypothetical protein
MEAIPDAEPERTNGIVQSGTKISVEVSPLCIELVDQYKKFGRRSAENIIELAKTVRQAKNLPGEEYYIFCGRVGLDPAGSTVRKLLVIADNATRFGPFVGRMPNQWTTIYQLAKLEIDRFERVTKAGAFAPWMTAKQVIEASGKERPARKVDKVVIDLGRLDPQRKDEARRELKQLQMRFRFRVDGEAPVVPNPILEVTPETGQAV